MVLQHRLNAVMPYDAHGDKGSYRIRSLYFDDYRNSALRENESGVDNRKKFRIRVYDNVEDRISLEIKYKRWGKTHKDSCLISRELCEKILKGGRIPFEKNQPAPLNLLYTEMETKHLRPRIIIEYERTAFVYPAGNVRITFDRNISFSNRLGDFMEDSIALTPILDKGRHVLEVKYDEFLPDFIAQVLELNTLERTSFSKFYYGCVGGA